jgi:hypothetical protein
VAPFGRLKVGVALPLELLVMAAPEGPQSNSKKAATPVIIPVVSRVSVKQVEVMT